MGLWPGASSALWLSLTALVIVVTEEDMVWILAVEVAQLSELLFAEELHACCCLISYTSLPGSGC